MDITREQATMLADLAGAIQEKYGFLIGYVNPGMPLPMEANVDFIIYENNEMDHPLMCFHKNDMVTKPMGPYITRVIVEDPEHDEKVQGLFDRLNQDLLNGIISFDPGVTRVIDDMTISVTKKRFPGINEDLFDTNIMSNMGGHAINVYPYAFICAHATHDKKFSLVKGIIDEMWPQPKPQAPPEPSIHERIMKLFKKWFL